MRCNLEEVDLDGNGEAEHHFGALSYVWGSKEGSQSLICDGKTILITPNYESALRHLRHAEQTVTLCVDAIVIDQINFAGRAEQVMNVGLVL